MAPSSKDSKTNNSISNYEGGVLIPCSPKDFGKFVADLISKPQQIRGKLVGNFAIGFDQIKQFHQLLVQRIERQNDNHFVQFVAQVYYSDNSSVRLNSLWEFENYHEIKPVESVVGNFNWTFLVHFKGKSTPEKQEIGLTVVAERDGEFDLYEDTDSPYCEDGTVVYSITHSEITWGVDIENLIKNYLKSIVLIRTGMMGYCQKNAYNLGHQLYRLTLLLSAGTVCVSIHYYWKSQTEIITNNHITNVQQKIMYSSWVKFTLYTLVFMFIIQHIITPIIDYTVKKLRMLTSHYLLLTDTSITKYNKSIKTKFFDRIWVNIILSIGVGILGNIVYGIIVYVLEKN